jgi:hypothetical protein
MRTDLAERAVFLAEYITGNRAAVRPAGKKFGISKSTIHTVTTKQNVSFY